MRESAEKKHKTQTALDNKEINKNPIKIAHWVLSHTSNSKHATENNYKKISKICPKATQAGCRYDTKILWYLDANRACERRPIWWIWISFKFQNIFLSLQYLFSFGLFRKCITYYCYRFLSSYTLHVRCLPIKCWSSIRYQLNNPQVFISFKKSPYIVFEGNATISIIFFFLQDFQ